MDRKQNMLEGKAEPQIIYSDTTFFTLPEPTGENREDLRNYDFIESVLDEYRSEGNTKVKIGAKYLFTGSLQWFSATKLVLKALQKAQCDTYFYFVLNTDKPDIKYKVRIDQLKYRFTKGLYGIGYTISVKMTGIDYLAAPGYGDLALTGYGTDYGNKAGNQPT
jgi:hypothetical protein